MAKKSKNEYEMEIEEINKWLFAIQTGESATELNYFRYTNTPSYVHMFHIGMQDYNGMKNVWADIILCKDDAEAMYKCIWRQKQRMVRAALNTVWRNYDIQSEMKDFKLEIVRGGNR